MKLVTFEQAGKVRPGIWLGDRVIDIAAADGGRLGLDSALAFIAAGQAALNSVINEQAQVIAYATDYRLMMLLTLAALPTLLLMRSPRKSAGGAPAHAAVPD